jgi:hypothetical protein
MHVPLTIAVDENYNCQPSSGAVGNGDYVSFNCAPSGGAKIVTSTHGNGESAFQNENGNSLSLYSGNNGPFYPNGSNFTINYCACAPQSDCLPVSKRQTGGYTIRVGSTSGQKGRQG